MSTPFTPRPYKLSTPQIEIDDLHTRLAKTRYAPEIIPYTISSPEPEAVAFGFGAHGPPLSWMRELAQEWEEYDWTQRETEINRSVVSLSLVWGEG